jgi:ubiquinone/menaquinone biosynthesis C-methylase UbiE
MVGRPPGDPAPSGVALGAVPQEVDNPLFARFFHRFCARDRGMGERELRRELLAQAGGRVVEVGAGNGINFEHYPASVAELIAVEPEPYLRRQAEKAALRAPVPVRVLPGVAASLGLAEGSVDVVVVCGVLCSVPDQRAALDEFRRVLRPGGELRFYEHVRSRRPGFARWQRRIDAPWARMMGGCHTDRDTLAAITDAGFRLERCRGFAFPAGARVYPVLPRVLGVARAG